jgi:hypothetical protein
MPSPTGTRLHPRENITSWATEGASFGRPRQPPRWYAKCLKAKRQRDRDAKEITRDMYVSYCLHRRLEEV